MRPLRALIDVSALRANLHTLQARAGSAQVIAVVKANAYGHGVGNVLPALDDAAQLAVACIEEALQLRQLGAKQPIILLEGIFDIDEIRLCAREHFIPVIHDETQLEWLASLPQYTLDAWLKVDTGMHRLGFLPEVLPEVFNRAKELRHINWQGVVSHFACADEDNLYHAQGQLDTLTDIVLPKNWQWCMANSAGLLRMNQAKLDWVRPGLALYGMSPMAGTIGADFGLKPVMSLVTKVLAVRSLKEGESAGYGQGFTAPESGYLATIAVG